MNRRAFLCATASSVGGVMLGGACAPVGRPRRPSYPAVIQPIALSEPSLGERGRQAGVLYGAAVDSGLLARDPDFASAVARECAVIVAEGEMKFPALQPALGRFRFGPADALMTFARTHQLQVRGHTLVWHYWLPRWFESQVRPDNAEQMLLDHIHTVVSRYAGAMHSWDVVNEAIVPEDGEVLGMRRGPWFELLGPRYIELAFRAAARADHNALLVYNDFGLDYATRQEDRKREAVLRLLEDLVARGVPIHALGVQAHLRAEERRFDPKRVHTFLQAVAGLGLQIFITELDVADRGVPGTRNERDAVVATIYREYLDAALGVPQVTAVLTWGLSDRYTWLASTQPRYDGQPVRTLPLDDVLRRKTAWRAMCDAFEARATARASG